MHVGKHWPPERLIILGIFAIGKEFHMNKNHQHESIANAPKEHSKHSFDDIK